MVNPRLALRTLLRTPFVTAVAVISLALGIGANAAIFSLFNQFLYRKLPVAEPDRLANLANPGPKPGSQSCGTAGGCDEVFSYQMLRDLQNADGSPFSSIAAHVAVGANLAYRGNTISGDGQMVSGSYFPTLGINPIIGRLLTPEDDLTIGAHPVAVISHSYWENNLGSDPGIVNDIIVVNGASMTVVGVAPPGFESTVLGHRPHVYVPITMRGVMYPGWDQFDNRRSYWAYLFARLRPGFSIEQASTAINAIYTPILREVEAPLQTGMSDQTMERFLAKQIVVENGSRGQSNMQEEAGMPLILLMSITGIVLLIACANIANLLMARGANRSLEMAVRLSLGAGRKQLLSQLLMESTFLALLGGVLSLMVASATLGLIGSMLPPDAGAFIEFRVDAAVMLSAAVLSITTGILFGIFPALHSTRPDLIKTIRANTGQPAGAKAAARFRATLVTAQIALSMTLLITAGLFVKSLVNVSRVDLGIETENVAVFGVSPVQNGYEPEQSRILFERLEEELAAQPGVTHVAAARVGLLEGNSWGNDVAVQGFEGGPDVDQNSRYNSVGPGYFRMLGVSLLAGREFTAADAAGSPRVVIVNETFAEKFGLGRDAVGMRMARNRNATELDMEIVGLIPDIAYNNVKQEPQPIFYQPYRQEEGIGSMTFYVRTSIEPEPLLRAVPQIVAGLDANLPVEDLKTLPMQVRENVVMDRMISTLSASFAALATILAAIGLYGVLAYTVAQRTREIGVRMALGADGRRVRAMVLKQVGWMTLIGGVIGIGAAIALGRLAESLLFEMQGHDIVVISLSAVILALTAFGAGELPAWRASRVNPTQALRYE